MKAAVVLLAGGEGRRIGGGKPLRTLGGRTLLDRAMEQARRWSEIVAIAVRDPAQVTSTGVALLIDDPAIGGPLAGLSSALSYTSQQGCDSVLTLPCDCPFLPTDLLERLAAARAPAAIACSGGQQHPVCGLWRAEARDALPAYLSTGRRSLGGFAEHVGVVRVGWPEGPFFNVNSSEDLATAEERLKS